MAGEVIGRRGMISGASTHRSPEVPIPLEVTPGMSEDLIDFGFPNPADRHESRDTFIIYIDGPGDITVRPCRPELLEHSRKVQEQIARWEAELKKQGDEGRP